MHKIKVNHYTETLIYSIDKTMQKIKTSLNQYISSLDNITAEQFAVLDTISTSEQLCQQNIAKILNKDKSNIKRIVEILEQKNFIIRKVGKKGKRLVNYLEITTLGKSVINSNLQKIKDFMETYFENITDEEIQTLRTLVNKFKEKN